MMTNTTAYAGLYALLTTMAKPAREAVVPEPAFAPFRLPNRDGTPVSVEELAPANSPAVHSDTGELAA